MNILLKLTKEIPVKDLHILPDYNADDPNTLYQYYHFTPLNKTVHLLISDSPSILTYLHAEQKIIINHPAPPNSNWYSVTSIQQIAEMLNFNTYLIDNNITLGGNTYAK